jgi:hypothetical protein
MSYISLASNANQTYVGAQSNDWILTAAGTSNVYVGNAVNYMMISSNLVLSSNAAFCNLTVPTTLDLTGATVVGFLNHAFSNASVSNLTVNTLSNLGAAYFGGAVSAPGQTITAATFAGALSGNATTATNAQGLTGSPAITVSGVTSTGDITASGRTVTAQTFTGALTGNASSATTAAACTGNAATATTAAACSGNAATATTAAACTGNAATASSCTGNSATATTATNAQGLTGSPAISVSGVTSTGDITASGRTVTAQTFTGALNGNAATATTAAACTGNAATASNLSGTPSINVTNVTSSGTLTCAGFSNSEGFSNAGNAVFGGSISAGNLGMFRNRIINGDMRINQRGATSLTIPNQVYTYMIDRFHVFTQSAGSVLCTKVALTTSDTPYQKGFRSSFKCAASSTTSIISSTTVYIKQLIESANIQDLNWGTSYGSSVTVSFWSRCVGAPSLPVTITTVNMDYFYNANIVVTSSGAWQYNTLTIPAPPSGSTWETADLSACGMQVMIGSYSASGLSSTLGWINGYSVGTTASSTWFTTIGNYVEFTGVQLEKGTIATPFEFRPFAVELQLCQRYYEIGPSIAPFVFQSGTSGFVSGSFAVVKRAPPSIIKFNTGLLAVRNDLATAINSGQWNSLGTITNTTNQPNMTVVTTTAFIQQFNSELGFTSTGVTFVFSGSTSGVWVVSAEL